MSSYDTNYNDICCPFCDANISVNEKGNKLVNELDDEEYDFFQCQKCNEFFKVQLFIFKEYTYEVREPTEKEIKDNNLLISEEIKKDIIEDVPGQKLIWNDLF